MNAETPGAGRQWLLFVYDSLMSGEPEHALLKEASPLGPAATEAGFDLVELGTQAALVAGGSTAVRGELYSLAASTLASIDIHKGHPLRYQRQRIKLEDGREVESYVIASNQARGLRRIRSGDWRSRFAPAARSGAESAWRRFARERGGR